MTHTEIYILLGVVFFITGFGGLVVYRECLPKFSPNRSVLRRDHWDIELQDVIQGGRELDLSSLPENPTSQVLINHMPIRWDVHTLPRFSHLSENTATRNTPPDYLQINDNFINSPLELDSLDINHWLIFLLIIIIIGFKCLKTNSIYGMSILIPFSLFEINFRDSFEWKFNSYRVKSEISYLKIQTLTEEIINLLNSLDNNENYSMSLSFISSYNEWKDNKEKLYPLFIDDAIIINKESNSLLITQFIMQNLNKKGYLITNQLFDDSLINSMDPLILTVIVRIKVKI